MKVNWYRLLLQHLLHWPMNVQVMMTLFQSLKRNRCTIIALSKWILLHSPSSYPCCYLSQNLHVVKCCVPIFSVVKYINAKFIWIFLSHSVNRNVLVRKAEKIKRVFSPFIWQLVFAIKGNDLSQGWITTPLALMSYFSFVFPKRFEKTSLPDDMNVFTLGCKNFILVFGYID